MTTPFHDGRNFFFRVASQDRSRISLRPKTRPMPQHEVKFSVPRRPLEKADIEFEVTADGERLGKLAVSKGAVVWFARNNTIGHWLTWEKFDELMLEYGRRAERR